MACPVPRCSPWRRGMPTGRCAWASSPSWDVNAACFNQGRRRGRDVKRPPLGDGGGRAGFAEGMRLQLPNCGRVDWWGPGAPSRRHQGRREARVRPSIRMERPDSGGGWRDGRGWIVLELLRAPFAPADLATASDYNRCALTSAGRRHLGASARTTDPHLLRTAALPGRGWGVGPSGGGAVAGQGACHGAGTRWTARTAPTSSPTRSGRPREKPSGRRAVGPIRRR